MKIGSDCDMIVDGIPYLQVNPFYVDQGGNCIAEAVRYEDIEKAEENEPVNLYELVYSVPEDDETDDAAWYDRIDWDNPEEVRDSSYMWLFREERRI